MKNVKELTSNELVALDGGVYPVIDGKGCTGPFLPIVPFGDPRDFGGDPH